MPASGFRAPIRLTGRYVELVPLDPAHASDLARALRGPETLRFFRSPPGTTAEEIGQWIRELLAAQTAGTDLPFATVLRSTGRPVGMTRFLRVDRANASVEIGGTWLDPTHWRSPLNTESKLLLLREAFDVEGVHRVQLQTDLRNVRSQRAIEALGAAFEARLREDVRLTDGSYRTSVLYSILESEWPGVRRRLEARLDRPWTPPTPASPEPSDTARGTTSGPSPATPPPSPSFRLPVTLTGRNVQLVPLDRSHVPALSIAGANAEIWTYLRIRHGETPEGMAGLVDDLLALQDKGEALAFAVLAGPDARASGITRYFEIDRPNRAVELGTWIEPRLWRTSVNTELKYLLLRHAFETERVHRLQLRTDEGNERSQRAILRLGAIPEGRIREHHRFAVGRYRTSLCYSVLAPEWPEVRARLERFLSTP